MGISIVSRRRLPASLSRRLIGDLPLATRFCCAASVRLVVTWHRLDGGDHFLVGDLFAGADEGRVAAIHEDREVVLSVAAQGVDEFLTFLGVDRPEVHAGSPYQEA